jgi:hypothetical protein
MWVYGSLLSPVQARSQRRRPIRPIPWTPTLRGACRVPRDERSETP